MKLILEDDGVVLYQENYLDENINNLLQGICWRNDQIKMFGKSYPQPRMTAWHGEKNIEYKYSKIKMTSPGWTEPLLKIKNRLEIDLKTNFNSVLINYYRDGFDHMSWHTDNEKELGKNPIIASLSFGEKRTFILKHRFDKNKKQVRIDLASGSLLIMKEQLQEYWVHKISKSSKITNPRLNLTFRNIITEI